MSERNSQFEKALQGLRALVLNGEFEAHARLPETALAERLDISRTPLRQAMERLLEEGLLERVESGRWRVASFQMADIIDAIEIRGVIEGVAVRLAAERGPDIHCMTECNDLVERIDAALSGADGIDFDAYVLLNAKLHERLASLAGSAIVKREVERVSRLPLASPSAFLQGQEFIPDFQASLRRAQDQHKAILDAIRSREGARAEALAREHARLARQNLEFVMQGDPSLVERVPGLALVSAG